ncbi:DUF4229 domain-containing protein [Actinocrispum wychmicini]|uniref:Uncharacterized protein DUF4229 n=1 Tax=Actinocrispum wychmicini TaxID=1213861 RepID=A0A4V2S8U6_9PSEU|nr:DUF4229 domain-containing protein [Actinocrispum wychmicini]TCO65250.1 uncharacterized protein DUF4229 [Actinocrispum wychmicini]
MEARLSRDIVLYTAARLGLVAVVAAVLVLFKIPLLVALAVAVVTAFPLSLLLLRGLNQRVTNAMNERSDARRAERARLRAQLRGEENS